MTSPVAPAAPTPRSAAAVQQEFNNLALKAGVAQYEIKEKQANLDMINTSMRDLSAEWFALQAADQRAKAALATKQADASLGATGPVATEEKAPASEGAVQ